MKAQEEIETRYYNENQGKRKHFEIMVELLI
jgi:hypothetical protein